MPRSQTTLLLVALPLLVGAVVLGPDLLHCGVSADDPAALGDTPLLLQTPPATAEPVVPVTVTARLAGARAFQIDVDLNHDGQFRGLGELAYAQGLLDANGSGTVRLHGLVPGFYQVRTRLTLPGGQEVVSSPQRLQVLPPPAKRLPVSFEANKGQADSEVLFLGRMQDCLVQITASEAVLVTTPPPADRKAKHAPAQVQRFRLVGADPTALPTGQKKLPGISNYFVGNDPRRWRTNIATYQEVVRPGVYPGIDLVYYSSQGRLEYDFRVAAGADPSVITLEFPDVSDLSIDEDGALVLHLADGQLLRKSAPVMYQEHRGQREAVKGDWALKGPKQAGYAIASYDPGRELVIDPYIFSTYFGGAGNEVGKAIAVDPAGNMYVTGDTTSANFPTTAGAFQTAPWPGPGTDAIIVKLNPTGTAVIYSTYLGGPGPILLLGGEPNTADSIAVDAAGNAYVMGRTTSLAFPTTPGAFQLVSGGLVDSFVTKLNPTGTALVYSTYLGGAGDDLGQAIAIDAAGNAYVGGSTNSAGFPVTPGVFQPAIAGVSNCYVAKLNPTGTALVYSSYLGGAGGFGHAFRGAVDGGGNFYVTGWTSSATFPFTPGAFQTVLGGVANAFVTKVNPTASALDYSTYLGGSATDIGTGIAVDIGGNAYVSGSTSSPNFPTTAGAFQTTNQGGANDAFVTKLNPVGSALVYSTYLGGSGDDQGAGIAIDAAGNAYVIGQTSNNTFPTTANATQATYGGGASDAFVTQVNPAGTALFFSTFLGGSGTDQGGQGGLVGSGGRNPIAVGASPPQLPAAVGAPIYVTGGTSSPDFPTLNAVQASNGGMQDLFITKLAPNVIAPPPPPPGSSPPGGGGSEGSFAGVDNPGGAGQEGNFGALGHFGEMASSLRVAGALSGPFLDQAGAGKVLAPSGFAASPPGGSHLYVFNVSGQVTAESKTAQAASPAATALAWTMLAALALVGALALGKMLPRSGA